jgi:hypothetical protein
MDKWSVQQDRSYGYLKVKRNGESTKSSPRSLGRLVCWSEGRKKASLVFASYWRWCFTRRRLTKHGCLCAVDGLDEKDLMYSSFANGSRRGDESSGGATSLASTLMTVCACQRPRAQSSQPPISVRIAALALYAEFPFRRVRHDGGRDVGALPPPQPFTGLLTTLLSLPMCSVSRIARQN